MFGSLLWVGLFAALAVEGVVPVGAGAVELVLEVGVVPFATALLPIHAPTVVILRGKLGVFWISRRTVREAFVVAPTEE